MPGSFVGRQAIYDTQLRVHAYELLFRSASTSSSADFVDGDKATAAVMLSCFLELGADRALGDRPGFLNLTRSYLIGDLPLPLPENRVVAEILEDIVPDAEVIAGVRRLKESGVRIALDDFQQRPGMELLLREADYVKIDLRAQSWDETVALFHELRPYGMKLLAEKVETHEEFELCLKLGFDYFQGFFLTRPEVVEGHRLPVNRLGILRLLSRLLDPMVEFDELETIIDQDVSLAYKLLQYANSALYAPQRSITAVHETLIVLGIRKVRQIASFLVFADLGDRPGDLINQALVRARMCALLAEKQGFAAVDAFYSVGLLSTLDALLGTTMDSVLKFLPLADEVKEALLSGTGDIGKTLGCVLAYERGEWGSALPDGLTVDDVREAFLSAADYARTVTNGMNQGLAA